MTSTSERGSGLPAWVFPAVAVVMTSSALFEGRIASGGFDLRVVLAALILGVGVLASRYLPEIGVVICALAAIPPYIGPQIFNWGGAQLLALMALIAYAGFRVSTRRSLLAYGLAVVLTSPIIATQSLSPWQLTFYTLVFVPPWLIGLLLQRERRRSAELARLAAELAAERSRQAEVAVTAERTRIARELHDAVAHSVSVMTLQIGVARHRLGEDHAVAVALAGAEKLGRQSVDELRRIVGLVRLPYDSTLAPLPSLANLEELLEPVRAAGGQVDLEVGSATDLDSLSPPVDMSAYRIIQESLTNALRHAPGTSVELLVRRDGPELIVRVRNPVAADAVPAPPGNGIIGMTERAAALGGELRAGRTAASVFEVSARLPVRSSTAAGVSS